MCSVGHGCLLFVRMLLYFPLLTLMHLFDRHCDRHDQPCIFVSFPDSAHILIRICVDLLEAYPYCYKLLSRMHVPVTIVAFKCARVGIFYALIITD